VPQAGRAPRYGGVSCIIIPPCCRCSRCASSASSAQQASAGALAPPPEQCRLVCRDRWCQCVASNIAQPSHCCLPARACEQLGDRWQPGPGGGGQPDRLGSRPVLAAFSSRSAMQEGGGIVAGSAASGPRPGLPLAFAPLTFPPVVPPQPGGGGPDAAPSVAAKH